MPLCLQILILVKKCRLLCRKFYIDPTKLRYMNFSPQDEVIFALSAVTRIDNAAGFGSINLNGKLDGL